MMCLRKLVIMNFVYFIVANFVNLIISNFVDFIVTSFLNICNYELFDFEIPLFESPRCFYPAGCCLVCQLVEWRKFNVPSPLIASLLAKLIRYSAIFLQSATSRLADSQWNCPSLIVYFVTWFVDYKQGGFLFWSNRLNSLKRLQY